MKGGAVRRVEPVARIEGQEVDFRSLRELRRLVHHEPTHVNAGLESHGERIAPVPEHAARAGVPRLQTAADSGEILPPDPTLSAGGSQPMLYRAPASIALLVLALLVLAASPGSAQTFVFHLRGDQEVPVSASVASGGCFGELDEPAGEFSLTCVHDVVGATVMHIHRGAAGATGPIVFDLGDPASPVTATWTGMTPADVADLLAGDLYVNIHTAGRPDGEIRGQILERTVDLVAFSADGSQVVPPNASGATASCTADLSNDATALAIACTHDVPSPQAAHVHEAPVAPERPGRLHLPERREPALRQRADDARGSSPTSPRASSTSTSTGRTAPRRPRGSRSAARSATRRPAPAPARSASPRRASRPAVSGFAFTDDVPGSPGRFTLDDGEHADVRRRRAGHLRRHRERSLGSARRFHARRRRLRRRRQHRRPVRPHRHGPARRRGRWSPARSATCEVEPADSIFVFHLSGDQEVPPVVTPDRGGCMGRFDEEAAELTLICVHDVASPTLMHVHRGAPGENGPILFDLGNPTSPVIATWSGMTPTDVADLLAGNLYVNIHTAGRPDGEIRGQILERTVDLVSFTADAGQVVPPGASTATGTCQADLSDAADELAVSCTHDLPAPDQAHLHEGARRTNGPLVFTFATATSPFAGDVPMTPRLVADFAAGFLYVDIHGVERLRGRGGRPDPRPDRRPAGRRRHRHHPHREGHDARRRHRLRLHRRRPGLLRELHPGRRADADVRERGSRHLHDHRGGPGRRGAPP